MFCIKICFCFIIRPPVSSLLRSEWLSPHSSMISTLEQTYVHPKSKSGPVHTADSLNVVTSIVPTAVDVSPAHRRLVPSTPQTSPLLSAPNEVLDSSDPMGSLSPKLTTYHTLPGTNQVISFNSHGGVKRVTQSMYQSSPYLQNLDASLLRQSSVSPASTSNAP